MYQESLPLLVEDKAEQRSYLMKKSLLEIDCPTDAIATMMQMEKFHKDHICYFGGPLVVHNLPWKDQLPRHLVKAVYLERLELVYRERKSNFGGVVVGNLAAQADVLAAMWPALMEAFVNPDMGIPWQYGKVGLYCCYEVGIRHKWIKQSASEFYGSVNMEPLSFKEIEADYKHVAADVRSKVVKQGKKVALAEAPSWSEPVAPPFDKAQQLKRPITKSANTTPSPIRGTQLGLF